MASSQPLNIYLVTFNCARNLVDSTNLATTLLSALPSNTTLPDILALSLQEIAPIANSFLGGSIVEPYLTAIAQTVSLAAVDRLQQSGNVYEQGDPGLVHVLTRHVGLTALMIFARPEIKSSMQWIKTAGAGCGLWEMGNKGAVGAKIGLEIARQHRDSDESDDDDVFEMTFVAAHLAPHEQNVEKRNQNFDTIVRNLGFTHERPAPSGPQPKKRTVRFSEQREEERRLLSDSAAEQSSKATGMYDTEGLVFFAGDLNYRTASARPKPEDWTSFPQLAAGSDSERNYLGWLSRDQLSQQLAAKKALHHFSEEEITFPPTYKYVHDNQGRITIQRPDQSGGSDSSWTWAPHRWPSWCDRILYLPSLAADSTRSYIALPQQQSSDHRPVALHVSIDPRQVKSNFTAPHPLNPDFADVRLNARRLEIVVGTLAYLGLTKEGKAIIAGILAGAVASWYVVHSII